MVPKMAASTGQRGPEQRLLALCAAPWGLVGYLIHLYTGQGYPVPLTGPVPVAIILDVYYPPRFVRDRLGVTGIDTVS